WRAWSDHLGNPKLRASFGIGFILLFAFVGAFTYVNFVLVEPPFSLSQSFIGLVYLVFLPSLVTTPIAGGVAQRYGARMVFWVSIGTSLCGLALLLLPSLSAVLAGLAIVGAGLFFAQAAATGYVGRTATRDNAAANGLYLTSYYLGGLAGALLLGEVFIAAGWTTVVATIAASLGIALLLGRNLHEPGTQG
ncbi:MAG: MFS transporter, partial [Pseudomonadota bacterium]